jgi:hypothetical protein
MGGTKGAGGVEKKRDGMTPFDLMETLPDRPLIKGKSRLGGAFKRRKS